MPNIANGGRTPWFKKFLGLGLPSNNGKEVFGETTASGYTVLDTGKLIASGKLKDDLEKFAQERKISRNGHPNGPQPERKS